MITNVSIATVFVKDVDAAQAFYTDVLGFAAHTDITLGEGYRWCTVNHPNQPELQIHLAVPGPPIPDEMVDMINRALDAGTMFGIGVNVDDCRKTYDELRAKERRLHPAAGGTPVRRGGRRPGQLRELDGPGRAARLFPGRLRRCALSSSP